MGIIRNLIRYIKLRYFEPSPEKLAEKAFGEAHVAAAAKIDGAFSKPVTTDKRSAGIAGSLHRFSHILSLLPFILMSAIKDHDIHAALIAAGSCAAGCLLITLIMFKMHLRMAWPAMPECACVVSQFVMLGISYPEPHIIHNWCIVILHGTVGLFALLSVVVAHPFTEGIMKDRAPRVLWTTAEFKNLNYELTSVWTFAFAGSACLALVPILKTNGEGQNATYGGQWNTWFSFVIPAVLFAAAVIYTMWRSGRVLKPLLVQLATKAGQPLDVVLNIAKGAAEK